MAIDDFYLIAAITAMAEKVGCLENDDLENEDLQPRKRRPRKRRPRKRRPRKRRPKKNRGEWGALNRSVRNAPSPDKTKIAYS